MTRPPELEVIQTLSDDEARHILEVLDDVCDLIRRRLECRTYRKRATEEDWSIPKWMDENSDET
jgi:hypothetical protein